MAKTNNYHTSGIQEKAVKYGKVGKIMRIYSATEPCAEITPVGTTKKYTARTTK